MFVEYFRIFVLSIDNFPLLPCKDNWLLTVCFFHIFSHTGAAEWTPTFLKVTGKGEVEAGWRGRWQQFGRPSSCQTP